MTFNQRAALAFILWPITAWTVKDQNWFQIMGIGVTLFAIAVVTDIFAKPNS